MRKSLLLISIMSIFSLLYIDGCIPSKPVQEEQLVSADRLIKRLEANRRKIKNFSGTGTITIKTSDINARSNFQVLIKRPDSVKVSFYGPFGIDLASALITRQNFQFYDVINNRLYKGKLKTGVMNDILKINISFEELLDLLTGSVNLTDKLRREPDKYETDSDQYNLTYYDSSASTTSIYSIRRDDLGITDYKLNTFKGKSLVSAGYSNFRKLEDTPVPFLINVNELSNNQKIKIEYRSVDVNNEIGKLKLDIPNDAKIIDW